ncbi:MAG: P-loop NTPase [Gemmatimonadetes bacterium]|nr:P-loop NTPase [Gemmatimonadota bacterium]MCB9518837.1 P-loop NTPase [Gemmatimonadales bacterium]HRX19701.1 P-loop NTPase [Gemmatimonadales bacterium]
MTDQARALRAARPAGVAFPEPLTEASALVIGSGKGGVGKSLVAVTLASSLAAAGRRVLLVDADFNLGTLHVLLGVRPAVQPEDLLEPEVDAESVIIPVAHNLWLMPAPSGAESVQRLGPHDRARFHRRVARLFPAYDAVVVDAAAGLDSALRVAAMQAARMVLVTTPEPTALTSAYALVKLVHGRLPLLPIDLLVNRTVDAAEGTLAATRMQEACSRFLGRTLRYLGAIPEDTTMRAALGSPEGLVDPAVSGPAQAALRAIVERTLLSPEATG